MLQETLQEQTIGIYRLASTKDNEKKTSNLLDLDKFYKSVIEKNVVKNTLNIPKVKTNLEQNYVTIHEGAKLDRKEKKYCRKML